MMYALSFVLRNGTPEEYPAMIKALEALGPWSDRLKPTWLLETDKSSRQVRDLLQPHLCPGDRVLVAEITKNWAAAGMGAGFGEWMHRRTTMRAVVSRGPVVAASNRKD